MLVNLSMMFGAPKLILYYILRDWRVAHMDAPCTCGGPGVDGERLCFYLLISVFILQHWMFSNWYCMCSCCVFLRVVACYSVSNLIHNIDFLPFQATVWTSRPCGSPPLLWAPRFTERGDFSGCFMGDWCGCCLCSVDVIVNCVSRNNEFLYIF